MVVNKKEDTDMELVGSVIHLDERLIVFMFSGYTSGGRRIYTEVVWIG